MLVREHSRQPCLSASSNRRQIGSVWGGHGTLGAVMGCRSWMCDVSTTFPREVYDFVRPEEFK